MTMLHAHWIVSWQTDLSASADYPNSWPTDPAESADCTEWSANCHEQSADSPLRTRTVVVAMNQPSLVSGDVALKD